MPYCWKCGAELKEEDNFCPKCGAPTKERPRTRRKHVDWWE